MSSSPLVDALRTADRGAIAGVLSDDVAFHSPVTDYRGRDKVAHVLATLATVIEDLRVRRELRHGRETATFVEAAIDGRAIEGVFDQIHDEAGRVREITLMLRPLEALLAGIERMKTALARA